ncbi:MAG: hypothetical protein RJA70_4696, partial [Pseudomonadota bacterium]
MVTAGLLLVVHLESRATCARFVRTGLGCGPVSRSPETRCETFFHK